MIKRPPYGIFPNLHVFPGGHVEENDKSLAKSEADYLKICAIRETLEETGVWPFDKGLRNFEYNKNNFEEFILGNRINLETLLKDRIHYWFTWRTPENRRVFSKQWDMGIFVTDVNNISKCDNYSTSESVESGWYDIEYILKKCQDREIHLAPPQWYMLKELEKIQEMSSFTEQLLKTKFPHIIQPKLISNEDESEWHSVLPGDYFYNDHERISVDNVESINRRLRRISMKRKGEIFYDFKMIER